MASLTDIAALNPLLVLNCSSAVSRGGRWNIMEQKLLRLVFCLWVLASCLLLPASSNGLQRIGLKKRCLDLHSLNAARITRKERSMGGAGVSGVRNHLGDSDEDILSLKNFLDAQYFGEIDFLLFPFKVQVKKIQYIYRNWILKKEGMKIYSCCLLMLLFLKILHSSFMLRNILTIRKHSLRIILKPMPNSATLGQNLILLRWVIKTHVLVLESTLISMRTQTISLKYLSGHPWIVISIACAPRLGSELRQKLEVQKHLNYLNKPSVKSIKSQDGDIIDCVHISHQPAFDHPYLKDRRIQMRPNYHPGGLFDDNKVSAKPKERTNSINQL